ncbi:MAG TPA: DUF4287 domain-containing protein [Nocardioidaceae bacterium]|jgi:3-mercaptopyruvate sulfurtransferase SseA|nr:DUF4287 domain-containing protein [Actinomycetota bacterium]MDQ3424551.1 DUF4287 domain-containing protein [Actinomycetota bacterium]HEV8056138.1 DUF4287 domain-containing protein [Nocardioidaceae bacterium]
MALHHSEETHRQLVERIPSATGRDMKEWLGQIDQGPGMLRFAERVSWLRDEYGLSHGYATAIAHEHNLRKAARAFQ